MARSSIGFAVFMSEIVHLKRWSVYLLRFAVLFFGWATLYGMFELDTKRLARGVAFALVSTMTMYWNDRRRANDQRLTTNDHQ